MSKLVLDVSEFQPSIDYAAAAQSIDGVIIRCGGTYYGSSHGQYTDDKWSAHYSGFSGQKEKIGAYFYAGAINDAQVQAEIDLTLKQLKGKKFDLPIFYDIEAPGEYESLSKSERTRLAMKWLKAISDAGYRVGVYTYLYYSEKLDMTQFENAGYYVWMAQYNSTLDYKREAQLWQYTSSGSISGINGNVDLSHVLDEKIFGSSGSSENSGSSKPVTPPSKTVSFEQAVKNAQKFFNDNFSAGLSVDGIWGNGTNNAAVCAWQRVIGAGVDGIVGNETYNKTPVLTFGTAGLAVSVYQALCAKFGYTDVLIDGIYGQYSAAAATTYQKAMGLDVDGKAGPATITSMLKKDFQ